MSVDLYTFWGGEGGGIRLEGKEVNWYSNASLISNMSEHRKSWAHVNIPTGAVNKAVSNSEFN